MRRIHRTMVTVIAALLATVPTPQRADAAATTAYTSPATTGVATFGGSLGLDFNVLSPIKVSELGVFDSGQNGLTQTITAQLYARSGNAGTLLDTLTFTSGAPGTLDAGTGDRFKLLSDDRILMPGTYTIVAYGYGAAEPFRNLNGGGGASTLNTGGGAIAFVGTSRFGTAGTFPGTPDGGPANRFNAGTFVFDTAHLGYDHSGLTNSSAGGTFATGIGLRFTPTVDIAVEQLGTAAFVGNKSGARTATIGAANPLTVQLFRVSDQTLLASVTITNSDLGLRIDTLPFDGYEFLKALSAKVWLDAGVQYEVVGYGYSASAQYLQNANGAQNSDMQALGLDVHSLIVHNGSYFGNGGVGSLANTLDNFGGNGFGVKYAGPTFSFVVPSPAALPAGLGLLALVGLRRRRTA